MAVYVQLREDGLVIGYNVDYPDGLDHPLLVPVASESEARALLGYMRVGTGWEQAPTQPKAPKTIDGAALIDLCQSAGGMTNAMLAAAYEDANLKPFWIKMQFASALSASDSRVLEGLQAVGALGYLPNGAAAVIEGWPTA